MRMKHWGKLLASLAIAVGCAALPGTATASAQAASINCNHSSGNGTPRSAAYLLPGKAGAVQLCKDSANRFWAYVVFYHPLAANHSAQAALVTYRNGSWWDGITCDQGGNGYVRAGQTRCWTKKVSGSSSIYTFSAEASYYGGANPASAPTISSGFTARCGATGSCVAG